MIKAYLSTSQLAQHYGVHTQTVRRWQRTGLIAEHHRTPGNHRRFEPPRPPEGEVVGYVRVSSHDQKSDLAVQSDALTIKAKSAGIDVVRTIQDIGSGMNYKKKGFVSLMAMLLAGKIKHLVIMHKDRLLRFGSEIVFAVCKAMNVRVTILEESLAKSQVELLCLELVEIMTVFTNKIYGMRSRSNKKALDDQLCPTIPAAV